MKNKKSRLLRLALIAALALVLVVSLVRAAMQEMDYRKGDETYTAAEQVAGFDRQAAPAPKPALTPAPAQSAAPAETEEPVYVDPYAAALADIDLDALRQVNDEVVGWIDIPGTDLSYPILQAADNEYYLNRTWQKEWNSVGSIFLECQVSPDFSDFNTIVYGHRMRNISMFGSLLSYKDTAYWEEHPSIYIVNDSGVHRYDVYAAFEAGTRDVIFGLGVSKDSSKELVVQSGLDQSVIDTGVTPTAEDQIITLSTCTGRGYSTRWVVQAVLRDSVTTPD